MHKYGRHVAAAVMAVVVASAILSAAPGAHALPAFRELIPNCLNVDPGRQALGHSDNEHGGGATNPFGMDFLKFGSTWNADICRADSDGDGETNGQELGDPCCIWAEGDTPSRGWKLSFPGDPGSVSGVPLPECKGSVEVVAKQENEFWDFYFTATGDSDLTVTSAVWGILTALWNAVAFVVTDPIGAFEYIKSFFGAGEGDSLFRRSNDLTSLITCFWTTLFLIMPSTIRRLKTMPLRDHLIFFFGAMVWTDIVSGMLHLVLDNPLFNDWPGIGDSAKAFQGHHYDPSGITRGEWKNFIREHHGLAAIIFSTFLFNPFSANLRVFFLHEIWQSSLMMAAHRWSHAAPAKIPLFVRALHKTGFLISAEHHSRHHATFDNNFCIYTGWTNPALNFILNFISCLSEVWIWILLAMSVTPLLFSYSCVNRPFKRQIFKVTDAVSDSVRRSPLLVYVTCAAYTAFVTFLAVTHYGASKAAHPVLMTVGVTCCMTKAMLAVRQRGAGRKEAHANAMMTGALFMAAALAAMLIHKQANGFSMVPHSIHALSASAVIVLCIVQAVSGWLRLNVGSQFPLPSWFHVQFGWYQFSLFLFFNMFSVVVIVPEMCPIGLAAPAFVVWAVGLHGSKRPKLSPLEHNDEVVHKAS